MKKQNVLDLKKISADTESPDSKVIALTPTHQKGWEGLRTDPRLLRALCRPHPRLTWPSPLSPTGPQRPSASSPACSSPLYFGSFTGAHDIRARILGKDDESRRKASQRLILQFSSVTQSCLTLCDPMNRSTPGLPVHHQLPEFTQTHVHQVSDAIQPSHPLSSPSPPAPNPSQHQGLCQ